MKVSAKTANLLVRPLPKSKHTTDELLADVRAGRFGKGVDLTRVKRAVARRSRSRELRSVK